MYALSNAHLLTLSGLNPGVQSTVHCAENLHLHSCWAVLGSGTLFAFWIEALSARLLSAQQKVTPFMQTRPQPVFRNDFQNGFQRDFQPYFNPVSKPSV